MRRAILVLLGLLVLAGLAGPPLLGWSWNPAGFAVWWLTNSTPPQVRLDGPDGPVRGAAQVHVVVANQDRADVAEARLDDQPLQPGWTLNVDTSTLTDGPHTLQVLVRDRSRRHNSAVAQLQLQTDNT